MAFQRIRDKMNQNQKPFIIGGIVIAWLWARLFGN